MRLGMTLKRCSGGFVLDLTSARSHKTSRFQGPTIQVWHHRVNPPKTIAMLMVIGVLSQTMSSLLNEPLSLLCTQVEFDAAGNETPYSELDPPHWIAPQLS
jgi:hypothetical protein